MGPMTRGGSGQVRDECCSKYVAFLRGIFSEESFDPHAEVGAIASRVPLGPSRPSDHPGAARGEGLRRAVRSHGAGTLEWNPRGPAAGREPARAPDPEPDAPNPPRGRAGRNLRRLRGPGAARRYRSAPQPRRGVSCPVSTGGGTRRVQSVPEGGGGGGGLGASAAQPGAFHAQCRPAARASRAARGAAIGRRGARARRRHACGARGRRRQRGGRRELLWSPCGGGRGSAPSPPPHPSLPY